MGKIALKKKKRRKEGRINNTFLVHSECAVFTTLPILLEVLMDIRYMILVYATHT